MEILYICTLALEPDLVLENWRLFTEEEESAKDEAQEYAQGDRQVS